MALFLFTCLFCSFLATTPWKHFCRVSDGKPAVGRLEPAPAPLESEPLYCGYAVSIMRQFHSSDFFLSSCKYHSPTNPFKGVTGVPQGSICASLNFHVNRSNSSLPVSKCGDGVLPLMFYCVLIQAFVQHDAMFLVMCLIQPDGSLASHNGKKWFTKIFWLPPLSSSGIIHLQVELQPLGNKYQLE